MDALRIVTLNLWADRDNPHRRLEVTLDGLRAVSPDLVALQEVREGETLAQASALGRALSMRWAFGSVDPRSKGGPTGNAILSRFPIERADNFRLPSPPDDPRCALKSLVELPGRRIEFTCCHLSWGPDRVCEREKQILAVEAWTRPQKGSSAVFLAGDFNARPESRAIRFLTGLDSLEGQATFYRDAWGRRHPSDPGYTFSAKNPRTVRWQEQNRRVDYVFVRGPVAKSGDLAIEEARLLFDSPAPDGAWASDHFGLLAVFRLA